MTKIIALCNSFKLWIIGASAALILILTYRKGREAERNNQMKGTLDAIKKAKQARDNLDNPDVTNSLHDKYRR